MAKKKRRKVSNRDFSNVKITLNIPFDLNKGNGNSFFANRLFDKSPELKEYLTKESFEKLYDTEFSEFSKDTKIPETKDKFGDALDFLQNGNLSPEQIQSFLGTLLGQTSYGEITNFEFPENSVGDSYVYAFNDGTPLFNPEFINNLQNQLDDLGLSLEDLQDQLQEKTDSNLLLQSGSESLGTQNSNLVEQNAALAGEVAALQAALALQPTFGIGGVENTGLPTTELTGNLNSDGLPTQIILNCSMNNITSKKITIYKISPEGNEGVGLNSNVVQVDSSGTPVLNREVTATDGSIRIGNTGSDRDITIAFESESVYIFEVTGENNAGVEDNTSPKTLTKSAIFTTIDTDDSQITQLSANLGTITLERDGLLTDVEGLTQNLNEAQTTIGDNSQTLTTLQSNLNNAVTTLDGFSDNIENKIQALKTALQGEAVLPVNTFDEVNSLIETFNNFVPNINSNTPVTSPVTQITGFDEDVINDISLTPQEFPSWLGGDSLLNVGDVFNDNILFDVDGEFGDTIQTPFFNVPSITYGGVETIPNPSEINESFLQNKILVVLRLVGIRYLQGGVVSPYLVRRVNGTSDSFKSRSRASTQMFQHKLGELHNFTEHSDYPKWFDNLFTLSGKVGSLQVIQNNEPGGNGSVVKSFDLANLSQNGLETSWQQGMSRGVGNLNLADISGYTEYSGGVNGLFTLNGGDSFKLKMDSQNLPFKTLLPMGAGGVIDGAHTFSVGIQFDFITRDNTGNFSFSSRQTTGNFTFNKGGS